MEPKRTILSILVLAGVLVLRLFLVFDQSPTAYLIVLAGAAFLWLLAYAVKKESRDALSEPEPGKKRRALLPMNYEGRTYTYVEDMPYEGQKRYYTFIFSLKKANPGELQRFLTSVGREDLAAPLQEARQMLADGLITEEAYLETIDQILMPQE